ncbi:DEAD-box ATP-dependent RNA helicase 21 [Hordeum vulgare]|nr:DEAD-box ATP-dependent RNA helicase 21 [Hordeum vulgare]
MHVDRHWTDKRADEMKERDWRILRKDFSISYTGSRVPRPMRSWAERRLGAEFLRYVDRSRYTNPTPIQMASVPLGLQRRDVIGVAQTGSGKTAAFLLPMLAYIAGMPPPTSHSEADEGLYELVLAPTRELA